MTKRETRDAVAPEVRFSNEATGTFVGYASVWNEPDSYGDTIKKGAFTKTLRETKSTGGPAMLWDHNSSQPIGVWTSLVEDDRGLRVEGRLVTKSAKGADAYELLKDGAIRGLSIGFRAKKSERGPNGGRILTDIELVEISLVTMPAASKARVTSIKNSAGAPGVAAFVEAARRAATCIRKTKT